jgi:hypothetical protein
MNKLEKALGSQFAKHKESVRTRSFTLGGHTFKVKVPLTKEFEEMQVRMEVIDDEIIDIYYQDLIKDLEESESCHITEDDVLVDGNSMKAAATNKRILEQRITELFRLLVPEEADFDMANITYPMIDELFPLPIQLQVIKNISETVSPGYEEAKGK